MVGHLVKKSLVYTFRVCVKKKSSIHTHHGAAFSQDSSTSMMRPFQHDFFSTKTLMQIYEFSFETTI